LINDEQFSEDFSNYWTAVLYFRAQNGTFKRVPQKPNVGFETSNGGMTVYYLASVNNGALKRGEVIAFKKGFRMIVGTSLKFFPYLHPHVQCSKATLINTTQETPITGRRRKPRTSVN
jgi:hypothetical protein